MNSETLHYILIVVIVLAAAALVNLVVRFIMNRIINKFTKRINVDPTNFSFIKNSIGFIIYFTAIIIIFLMIPFLKTMGAGLLASAGILAAIIGFASQKAFANIIGGIFILMFKPFRVGDTIEVGSLMKGVVEEITLRHTVIRNYENRRMIIPNANINDETIINSTISDIRIRKFIDFGISYDSNIDKAMSIIREEIEQHKNFLDIRTKQEIKDKAPAVTIFVSGLSDFSVNLRAYAWTPGNDEAFGLQCDVLKSVKERFDKEGVEIPFPYRTIVYKKDLDEQKTKEA
ncbi:MAG: mechanosensitive ion channel protein MscS [Marinilabiliales bacterium]|nr:MAG: mechanosensitive ion channel protein MscS [Marinilabiliales bacterium]